MKPLHSETDYNQALKRVEAIRDAKAGSPELHELEMLVSMIEKYETILYPLFVDSDPKMNI
jgi:HTH-type transcriptional regulator/antitoxin HigA